MDKLKILHDYKKLAMWRRKIETDFTKWSKAMDKLFEDLVEKEEHDGIITED